MGVGSGEVVSHSKVGSDYFIAVADNPNGGVSVYKWVNASQKYQYQFSIDASAVVTNFKTVSSVALDPRGTGLGALVAQVDDPAINTTGDYSIPQLGRIIFFDVTDGSIEGQTGTGYHPDMVAISTTGIVAVANEAEYAWDTNSQTSLPANNQNGSVSLYDLSSVTLGNFAAAATATEVNVDFTAATLSGVRYGTAEEIEPEYIAFDSTGDAMFVGAQENNTIFRLDGLAAFISSPGTPAWEVFPLGSIQYTADVTNNDLAANINTLIKGLHMPDAIAVYEDSGTTYVVTADEGDARPDDSDITRAEAYDDGLFEIADTPVYDDGGGAVTEAELLALVDDRNQLGRLNVLIEESTVDGLGVELTDIVAMGSRGITIWAYDDLGPSLTRVSHLPLEAFLLAQDPTRHNSNDGGDPGAYDARSDDKGPEPEAVSVIQLGSKIIAMVGCERQNGVVMVDITNPASPAAISYINNRDNALISPETVKTVPAAESPTGAELAIFGFEGLADDGVEGGIGIYNLEKATDFTLTVLHNNDGESDLFSYKGSADHGGIARFKSAMDAHHNFYSNIGHGVIEVFAGDSFLAGPEFQASLDSGVPGARTFYDAIALSRIGYDAFAIGNHEMDFGPDVLAEFIGDAQSINPSLYLSANLDFTNEADMLAQQVAGNVAKSTVVNVPTASGIKKIGIIGATTDNLPFISSPRNTIINAVAASVNTEIASLLGQSVDAIVLVSHLQGLTTDEAMVPMLNAGVDVIVAGGGDELLVNQAADSPRVTYGAAAPGSVIDTGVFSGDTIAGTYPQVSSATDLGGNNIPIVTGAGNYGYLNRLTLAFTGSGVSVETTSNPALIVSVAEDATNGFAEDADVLSDIAPVQTFLDTLAATVIGNTNTTLPHSSGLIRSDERAVGNLVADAYLAKAQELAAGFGVDSPQIALANGGGIRAPINAGDITLQTTFNVSPFGNFVSIVEDVTTADLKLLLENCYSKTIDSDAGNGVTPTGTNGRFAQIAGLQVVYDISKTAMVIPTTSPFSVTTPGVRVISAKLDDDTDLIVDGVPVPAVTVDIAMPAFSAAGGDQWFRYESNGSEYYTANPYTYTALGVTDQQALADYISGLDGTADGTGPALDGNDAYNESIKDNRIITISDRDSDGIVDLAEEILGTDPDSSTVLGDLDLASQFTGIASRRAADIQTGEDNVTNNPGAFSLYDETSILDLRTNGQVMVQAGSSDVTLTLDVQKTTDLGTWVDANGDLSVTLPKDGDKEFYRISVPDAE